MRILLKAPLIWCSIIVMFATCANANDYTDSAPYKSCKELSAWSSAQDGIMMRCLHGDLSLNTEKDYPYRMNLIVELKNQGKAPLKFYVGGKTGNRPHLFRLQIMVGDGKYQDIGNLTYLRAYCGDDRISNGYIALNPNESLLLCYSTGVWIHEQKYLTATAQMRMQFTVETIQRSVPGKEEYTIVSKNPTITPSFSIRDLKDCSILESVKEETSRTSNP